MAYDLADHTTPPHCLCLLNLRLLAGWWQWKSGIGNQAVYLVHKARSVQVFNALLQQCLRPREVVVGVFVLLCTGYDKVDTAIKWGNINSKLPQIWVLITLIRRIAATKSFALPPLNFASCDPARVIPGQNPGVRPHAIITMLL